MKEYAKYVIKIYNNRSLFACDEWIWYIKMKKLRFDITQKMLWFAMIAIINKKNDLKCKNLKENERKYKNILQKISKNAKL